MRHKVGVDRNRARLRRLLIGCSCLAAPAFAHAQPVAGPAPAPPAGSADPSQQASTAAQSGSVSEVVVTANRREQTLQTVATSVDVVQGAQAEKLGYNRFEDYLPTISGLGFSQDARGNTSIAIRGQSNLSGNATGIGSSAPTVAVYFNDIPVQGIAAPPDLSLYDLQRIEVLKGPQGTLYGASAMGGAIKLITNAPNLQRFEAKTQLEGSFSGDSNAGGQAEGAFDAPIVQDRVGLRVTASYRREGGYIDNTARDRTTGDADIVSVRGDLRVRATDALTVDVLAMHQQRRDHGFNNAVQGAGDLKSNVPDPEFSDRKFDLFGLTATYRLPFADLSSITSYWRNSTQARYRTSGIGYDNAALFDFGLDGFGQDSPQALYTDLAQTQFSQELRLTSRGAGPLHWTVGGIYTRQRLAGEGDDAVPSALINGQINAAAAGLGPVFASVGGTAAGALLTSDIDAYRSRVGSRLTSYAGFGNVAYDITPNLTLEAGLRGFRDEFSFTQHDTAYGVYAYDFALFLGPLSPNGTFDALDLNAKASDDGVVPKVNLSWRITPRNMVYAQYTEGFRPGGANYTGAAQSNTPRLFNPDSSRNYEVGTKNTLFDGRLTINAAAYYIDWSDIQLRVAASPASYLVNAGDATIYGGELALFGDTRHGLTYGTNLGLVHAALDKVSSAATGAIAGATIPNSPKVTSSSFVQYARPLTPSLNGYLRAQVDYRAREAVSLVTSASPRQSFYVDGFATVRLQAGVETGRYGLYGFIDNLTDERGEVGKVYSAPIRALGYTAETQLQIIRPRTFGLRFTAQY